MIHHRIHRVDALSSGHQDQEQESTTPTGMAWIPMPIMKGLTPISPVGQGEKGSITIYATAGRGCVLIALTYKPRTSYSHILDKLYSQ